MNRRCLIVLLCLTAAGSGKPARAWDTNEWQFLETMQRANLRFFQEQKRGPYDLLNDTADYDATGLAFPAYSSVAGIGFELTALCIGHYRGWISYAEAYERVLKQVRAFDGQLSADPNVFHKDHGWTHHTYWIDGADAGKPFPGIDELSLLDHSLFIGGCIFVSEYFKGTEAGEIARKLYADTQWDWRPNGDYNFGYSENLLAIIESAEAPQFKKGGDAFTMWQSYIVPPFPRTLQLYFWQYPHAWIDFRFRTDQQGNNHTDIARDSILYQRQRAIDLHNADPAKYDMIGTNVWGWTAASSSGDAAHPGAHYRQMAPWPLFLDASYDEEHASDSGSITPIGLPGCMVYAGTETMASLKYVYEQYFVNGWDPAKGERGVWSPVYGWINCFNKGRPYRYYSQPAVSNWFWPVNAAIDYGPNVLLLENYKLGTTWRYFMQNPNISAGMTTVGFGPTQHVWRANFSGNSNDFGCGFGSWNNDGTPVSVSLVDADINNGFVGDKVLRVLADNNNEGGWLDLCHRDQRARPQLSFWVKGHTGLETIELGLKDIFGKENKALLSGYTGGSLPTNWTLVKIPMEQFCLTGYLTNDTWAGDLDALTFAFQNPGGGGLDVDVVAFTSDTDPPSRPDAGFGAAQTGRRPQVTWHPELLERDVIGLRVWRREDAISGFSELTTRVEPLHHNLFTDSGMEGNRAREVRYAIQSCDNAEPQLFSPFALEHILPLDPRGRLDLDWNNGMNPNTLGGSLDGWFPFEMTNVFAMVVTNKPDGNLGWVRRSVVTQSGGGHFIFLNDSDLGDYGLLQFWVRSAGGNPVVDLGLKDSGDQETRIDLGCYIPGGEITTNWTRVRLPFNDFPNVDFSSMDNISLTYAVTGEVQLADISFLPNQRADLDHFQEAEHWDGQTGSFGLDFKPVASGGQVLGNSWGGGDGDFASYYVYLDQAMTNPVVFARYACFSGDGRELEVEWDGVIQGNLIATNTGGWGDTLSQFSWSSLVLPASTAGTHQLVITAQGSDDAVNVDGFRISAPGFYFRECEDFDQQTGSGGEDVKPGASGGAVLGNSWGDPANSQAVYSNVQVGAQADAWLHLWYARDDSAGRRVDVHVDGTWVARLVCPGTRGWGDRACQFNQVSAPLGPLSAGNHSLRLSVPNGGQAINLDAFYVGPDAPDHQAARHDSDALSDRQEEVLGTSPSAPDSDGDGISDSDELIGGTAGRPITDPTKADTDNDGFNDLEELIAETDPNNIASFWMVGEMNRASNGLLQIEWPATSAREYRVYSSEGVYSNPALFELLAGPSDVTVEGGSGRYRETNPPPHRVYRLGVSYAP